MVNRPGRDPRAWARRILDREAEHGCVPLAVLSMAKRAIAGAPRYAGGGMIVLELPWPPSVNGYWRSPNKGPLAGRTLISERGRAYRAAVAREIERHRPQAQAGRLAVHVDAFPPDRRKRDLDNIGKGLLDALAHAGVIRDDGDIDRCSVERGYGSSSSAWCASSSRRMPPEGSGMSGYRNPLARLVPSVANDAELGSSSAGPGARRTSRSSDSTTSASASSTEIS